MNLAYTLIADQPQCHWVCALPAEARAIIDHYHLKRSSDWSAFPLYVNQKHDMQLVVTGVGKLNAAIGLTYAWQAAGRAPHAYACQVGIAGSCRWPVGEAVLVHRVVDASNQSTYYPLLPKQRLLPTATCVCYDQVQHTYHDDLFDMESSGFFHAASRLLTQDQVQIVKLVSDTCHDDQSAINPAQVTHWVSAQLPAITSIATGILHQSHAMMERLFVSPIHEAILDRWHFTHYQTHQLRQLCRRWSVIMSNQSPMSMIETCVSSKSVLCVLRSHLDSADYGFEELV